VPKRAEEPPAAIHVQIASGPNGGQTDVAGKNRVRGRPIADRFSDLLRMDKALAATGARQLIKFLA
jgi:hypothetical protein